MATSPWVGIKWLGLGLLALLIGAVWFLAAARPFNLWLYADHYVAAEFEVTRFHPQLGEWAQGRIIEGVIHPSGEPVQTSDSYIAIRQFVDPNDVTGRRVPLRSELEGRRLAVWHWPQHAAVEHWWHPPTVVMPGATQRGGVAVCEVLVGGAFVGIGLFCFRRGFRHLKAAASPEPHQ
jgi:hypothetical protein